MIKERVFHPKRVAFERSLMAYRVIEFEMDECLGLGVVQPCSKVESFKS